MRSIVIVPDQGVEDVVLRKIEMALFEQLQRGSRRGGAFPNVEPAFLAKRRQYDSAWILEALAARCPENALLLGVTPKDLCLPMLSFVFGHAQLGGPVSVVSLARLRQDFYMLPEDPALLEERAVKEALHEVGHALGLVHCAQRSCVMSLATDVEQVDAKEPAFCRTCRTLLHENDAADGEDETTDLGKVSR